jgi:hypothetical protein
MSSLTGGNRKEREEKKSFQNYDSWQFPEIPLCSFWGAAPLSILNARHGRSSVIWPAIVALPTRVRRRATHSLLVFMPPALGCSRTLLLKSLDFKAIHELVLNIILSLTLQ